MNGFHCWAVWMLALSVAAATAAEPAEPAGPAPGLVRQTGLQCIGALRLRRAEEIGGSRWGVSCHWIADKHPLSVRQQLEQLAAIGAKSALLVPNWDLIELQPGRYDWNNPGHRLDDVVQGLVRRKIRPVMQIYGGNHLYTPLSPPQVPPGVEVPALCADTAARAAWHRFLAALVRRYQEHVKVWEVWNEPNIDWFWKPKPDAKLYGRMVKEVAAVIRSVDPQAVVLAGSTANVPLDYLRGLAESDGKNSFDAVSIHPYAALPDETDAAVRQVRKLLADHGRPTALWQSECGFPSRADTGGWGWGGPWDETKQAKWVLRRLVCDAALGMQCSIYFVLNDYPAILEGGPQRGKMGVNRKGLYAAESWAAKPAAYAYAHLAGLLDERLELKTPAALAQTSAIRTLEFGRKGRKAELLVYWRPAAIQSGRQLARTGEMPAVPPLDHPVLVDLLDGRVYELQGRRGKGTTTLENLPLTDYPLVLCNRALVEVVPADPRPQLPGGRQYTPTDSSP